MGTTVFLDSGCFNYYGYKEKVMDTVYEALQSVISWLFPDWLLAQPITQILVYGVVTVILCMVLVYLVMLPFVLFRKFVKGK